jgi:N-acetyl sugar amidotransferase
MPDTRPGITFNDEGVCSACQYEEKKDLINWHERWRELELLCNDHRSESGYDCIITVSGGKDSHWQVGVFKEALGMHPLLISVSDNFKQTDAGVHNAKNISERYGCDLMVFKPNIRAEKLAIRYAFEKYLKPTFLIDRYIYTYPLWMAKKLGIPLLIYGENVSCEYGGVDAVETPSAMAQVNNGVASGISKQEFIDVGISPRELEWFDPPMELDGINPIYLSYYHRWNSYENYKYAKRNGFIDLSSEWDRSHHAENFDQIDSPAYLVHSWAKYPKFGHAQATDYCSKFIRYGMMTREEAIRIVNKRDGDIDSRCVKEFCDFAGYSLTDFWSIVYKFYNKDLFYLNNMQEWKLKEPLV